MSDLFLVLYFFLLFYVAVYGFHLYWVILLYLKHRHTRPQRPPGPTTHPLVTVQLPVYNERLVVARLIEAVAAFDWPRDRFEIQVLDDSDDGTSDVVAELAADLHKGGTAVHHLRRDGRDGYKAGALKNGLLQAKGEFVAVFDADNVPRTDFLKQTVPFFTDQKLGLVQARWSFLNRNESLLCRAQALFLDAHFYIEQAARSKGGLFMNFNGTAGVWRRSAIEAGGGWQADTLTEDLDLSYRVQMAGWRMLFLEDVDVPTELPSSIRSFKAQQFRWTKGAIETARKVLPALLTSEESLQRKACAFFHLTQKSIALALLLLSVLLVPALYVRMEGGVLKLLLIDLPIVVLGTGSMSIFYGLAYRRENIGRSVMANLVVPVLTSLGIALSINNSLAILAALTGRYNVFVRTPKTGTRNTQCLPVPADYRIPFDLSIRAEMFFALYAVTAIGLASTIGLYLSVPFLLTFAMGFSYFSYLSLKERYA